MTKRVAQEVKGSNGNRYVVYLEKRWCTCPAMRFQKKPAGERTCKHLEAVLNGTNGNGRAA